MLGLRFSCRRRFFGLATVLFLAVGFSMVCRFSDGTAGTVEMPPEASAEPRDFVEYWAAARLFAQNGNPYSPSSMLEIERRAGWSGEEPLMMWNPPWALPLVLPFGYLNFVTGQFFWLVLHICALLVAAQFFWSVYHPGGKTSRGACILALTFVPSVFVLVLGQITPLVAAGGACFVFAARNGKVWLASAGLALLSLKPQLLYLFWIVLALWIWEKRLCNWLRPLLMIGAAAALLPLLLDPLIYSKYLALYDQPGIRKPFEWPAPTLRNVLRVFLGIEQIWLQLAPSAGAVLWAVWHWRRNKETWSWDEQFPLLALVSIAAGFFAWTYDYVVALPALLYAAGMISQNRQPWYRVASVWLYLAINGAHGVLRFWLAEELWYFWLAPALLFNYLLFRRELESQTGDLRSPERRVQ